MLFMLVSTGAWRIAGDSWTATCFWNRRDRFIPPGSETTITRSSLSSPSFVSNGTISTAGSRMLMSETRRPAGARPGHGDRTRTYLEKYTAVERALAINSIRPEKPVAIQSREAGCDVVIHLVICAEEKVRSAGRQVDGSMRLTDEGPGSREEWTSSRWMYLYGRCHVEVTGTGERCRQMTAHIIIVGRRRMTGVMIESEMVRASRQRWGGWRT
ncbi:hypothetical protein EDC01DRAFT_671773 [Geopyxis carbonaria]|nr:hypothetical protein EDC01DRAFT_671773 [Geopyxis carbonaria]